MSDELDVLIIGAGLSGIGMASHLARACPSKQVALLERRRSVGGTWDLFRYPGIRSDSDMLTFGFDFRPWTGSSTLAAGSTIRAYVEDTAREYDVARKIHFGLKTVSAAWSSETARWTVVAVDEATGAQRTFTARFLIAATGYYSYDDGYLPRFEGQEDFAGLRVHPQHWPEGLDYRGKQVVVIGSGATAVTLVPAMAGVAGHITMLQRSPGYVFSLPGNDTLAQVLKKVLPERWVYRLARWRNLKMQRFFFRFARRFPERARRFLLRQVRRQVGDGVDMAHFTPRYAPWDERLCAVPDGDLFKVLRAGQASVVTDDIVRFTRSGVLLKSGRELPADIIVTATGLNLQLLGGMTLTVDGRPFSPEAHLTYKAVLVQDVPNFAALFGYTNASWTLKVDLAARYLCRLLDALDAKGARAVTPRAPEGQVQPGENMFGALSAGYVKRGEHLLLRQGRAGPWRVTHDYEQDRAMLGGAVVDGGELEWT